MTELLAADQGQPAHIVHLVDSDSFQDWRKEQPQRIRALLDANRYDGETGYAYLILPGENDDDWSVVSTVANVQELSPWCLAKLGEALPEGTYRLADDRQPGPAMLGWLLAQHRFDDYRSNPSDTAGKRVLLTKDVNEIERTRQTAEAVTLVRDMVDTPAEDMGPAQIEERARQLAEAHGATVSVTRGGELESGYPMVHAVGRAATKERAPRLVELEWGRPDAPRLAIVGKGVVFDSGGLDIKSGKGMRLMKKDMGGAAHAIALAKLVMERRLPVRLHLLVPAVENAVSGDSFRPGDVLDTRKGLKVEIDNTDAEGRLILGDALTKAVEDEAAMIIDFATLTGAARVALGPDLPAMFANDEQLASDLISASQKVSDPIWRLPLWDGYDEMLKSTLADMVNSATSPFAGSITAALFLRRFVPEETPWAHFDTFAWQPAAKPGRPKGGEALGLRAAMAMLEERFARD
ncbi:leucyl aminopeptidase family protein [Sphingomicrobium lutaoense]|uniref:Leucyl aminopeptidase n=1 Tax=Sphingomicrobium lutaoense TaxID=515949 RepID=A0A839Z5N1_9SPHN|nr:leucyl aminopeptidase family protein [Sphingomicrobium lutaoense]MBB3763994.1 leucyl aminopeptidase [Sphingomicrobium lutaoense]